MMVVEKTTHTHTCTAVHIWLISVARAFHHRIWYASCTTCKMFIMRQPNDGKNNANDDDDGNEINDGQYMWVYEQKKMIVFVECVDERDSLMRQLFNRATKLLYMHRIKGRHIGHPEQWNACDVSVSQKSFCSLFLHKHIHTHSYRHRPENRCAQFMHICTHCIDCTSKRVR